VNARREKDPEVAVVYRLEAIRILGTIADRIVVAEADLLGEEEADPPEEEADLPEEEADLLEEAVFLHEVEVILRFRVIILIVLIITTIIRTMMSMRTTKTRKPEAKSIVLSFMKTKRISQRAVRHRLRNDHDLLRLRNDHLLPMLGDALPLLSTMINREYDAVVKFHAFFQ
jgi:hypothetical protein